MTGPGAAATTRTSTPKSPSFFSIMRLVISSDSGVTVCSMRVGAASRRSTCGSLLSCSSTNSGFWRSRCTRLDSTTCTISGSITIGACSTSSMRISSACSSRSRSAISPMRSSSARSRATARCSRRPSIQPPMPSARCTHEKRNAPAMPSTSAAIHNTPEPRKPRCCIDSGPSRKPSTPPEWPPGTRVS
jgi:hypothetical protein